MRHIVSINKYVAGENFNVVLVKGELKKMITLMKMSNL